MDVKQIASFVKIEHTLFSLPFVFIGAFVAGSPSMMQLVWILVAAIGARGLAMGLNRIFGGEIQRLPGGDMESEESRKRFGLKTKYRVFEGG